MLDFNYFSNIFQLGQGVTQGYLLIVKDNLLEFMVHNQDGNNVITVPISNIAYSRWHRIQDNTLELGWLEKNASQVGGIGWHMSAEL